MARERVEGKNKIKRINLQERIEAIIEISICKAMAEDWHPKKMIAVASFNIKDLIQNNYRRRKQVRS